MVLIALVFVALAILDPVEVEPSLRFTVNAVLNTLPYMNLAVAAIGFLKATGAEKPVARALQGNETRMIVLALLIGGLSPFCTCEIIPFIAALLAVGTPLSAVMALWLASPIMDPASFVITSGELGLGFAVAKTLSAVCLGLLGGFAVRLAVRAGYFQDILLSRSSVSCGGGCGSSQPYAGNPVWAFWTDTERLRTFWSEVRSNGFFLLKWLSLAYLFESLMLQYVPAEAIAGIVGGTGLLPILTSAFVGAPAYLNGYAAPAIVSGLMDGARHDGGCSDDLYGRGRCDLDPGDDSGVCAGQTARLCGISWFGYQRRNSVGLGIQYVSRACLKRPAFHMKQKVSPCAFESLI